MFPRDSELPCGSCEESLISAGMGGGDGDGDCVEPIMRKIDGGVIR